MQRKKNKGEEKKANKRPQSKSLSGKAGSSQYDAHTSKMAEVDEIYKSLDSAHGTMYSSEQKRTWAARKAIISVCKPFFIKNTRHTIQITRKEGKNTFQMY